MKELDIEERDLPGEGSMEEAEDLEELREEILHLRQQNLIWEKKLSYISEALTQKNEDFFRTIVRGLAKLLDFKYAFIGKLTGKNSDHIKTLAYWKNGSFADNFEYSLLHSPCDTIISSREPCYYPEGVSRLFPKDIALGKLGAESYFGIPIFGSKHQLLGILVAINDRGGIRFPGDEAIIKIFGSRAGVELEQRLIQEALEESESRYRTLFEKAQHAIFILEPDGEELGRILDANPAAAEMHGYTMEEVLSMNLKQLDTPIEAERLPGRIFKMMSGQWIREEIAHQKKDGTVFPVEVFAGKIEIGGRWVVIAIENDISERRKREQETQELEHQLYQAQKMESIGRLAGGIAHDFDNMLTSIMGYAEFLKMRFTDNTTREGKATETILRNAERAANLTKQLLDFSRRRKYHDLIPIDLHGAVKKTVNLTERLFEDKIVVEYDFPEDIPAIEADENQLHQVLTNLIINARDAMPRGGKISFKTGTLVMESGGEIHKRPLQPGHYVYLIIADSGEGMSQEVVEKVFEPFFTTKGMNGTGLGLATVYSIMKNHGGHVRCKSAPGVGTTFELFFPTTVQSVSPDKEETHMAQGQGEILLIEGNDDIRGLMHQQLSILGYQLDSVKTGEEGLELLKGKPGKFDLLLVDFVVPGMDKKDFFKTIKESHSNLKIIVFSNFYPRGEVATILEENLMGVLDKPIRMRELATVVSEVLSPSN